MHFGAFLQPVLISVLLVLPAGCTLKSAGPGGRAVVHVERLADEGVYFHGVHVHSGDDGLVISGELKRRYTHVAAGRGHVDVAVIGPGGDVIGKVSTFYVPKVISTRGPRGSYFRVHLPFSPPNGSVVRIVHHRRSGPAGGVGGTFDCGANAAAGHRSR